VILGVDHLALSATDLDVADAELSARGFDRAFSLRDIPNHPSKAHLLHDHQPVHDLAFYRHPTGVAIEVTVHGPVLVGQAPFTWAPDAITLQTPDEGLEATFLQEALRFRGEEGRLALGSPVPGWSCTLQLVTGRSDGPPTLDAVGHPCLALLTNDIEEDLARAGRAGATNATGAFSTHLDGRSVTTALFRAPTGTIFELVQIDTGDRR